MPSFSPRPAAFGVDTTVSPAERYRIVGRIAIGGMAEIYLSRMASNAGIEREVVLKRLLPELQNDHEFVQMFHDEARIASQLSHPNVVQIYELGELDGSLFIAMELLRGVNLRDLLARLHDDQARIPTELAVRVACGALEALDYAHHFTDAKGRPLNVVHRDVSPQNIIVTYEGTVKLVDFGVAKAEGKLHQTRAGLVKGKFAYMSPEQINGTPVDGRSDLFALAEVFYELLLHRHPFYAETDMDVLRAILDKDPPHPSAMEQAFSPQLGAILLRAMRKKPGDRYTDAAAMQDALEHYLLEAGTPATTIKLGRYVRELFDDRMALEQRARETSDDDLLIEAMTVGRADQRSVSSMQGPPTFDTEDGQMVALTSPADYRADESEDATLTGILRERHVQPDVIDVSPMPRQQSVKAYDRYDATPAEDAPPGAFGAEIRNIFEAEPAPRPDVHDADEAPTMLGGLSEEQMAEVRSAAEDMRKRHEAPSPPEARRSSAGGLRSDEYPVGTDRLPPRALVSSPDGVTSRSATVLQPDADTRPPSARADQWGIWFFIVGLGALVGAVVYAIVLLSSSTARTMNLEVQSVPAGATVLVDGFDIGAVTPTSIPTPADATHKIVLELEGYATFEREIEPSPELAGETYVIHWRFVPLAKGPPQENGAQ